MISFSTTLAALCAVQLASARVVLHSRATTSVGTLYGYGANLTGLPLFYGDGIAYLGNQPPADVVTVTNLTCEPASVLFLRFELIRAVSITSDGALVGKTLDRSLVQPVETDLFIDQATGAFVSAGFTAPTNTSVTITGFELFGRLLVWQSSSGEIRSKWWDIFTKRVEIDTDLPHGPGTLRRLIKKACMS